MWLDFIAQNIHFAIMLYAALACLGVSWLYLDAWLNGKRLSGFLKWTGFFIVSCSFFIHAITLDRDFLGGGVLGSGADDASNMLRLIGYILIALGLFKEPLQEVPVNPGLEFASEPKGGSEKKRRSSLGIFAGVGKGVLVILPAASAYVAWQYWRRSTTGLERHLKPLAKAFMIMSLVEIVGLRAFLVESSNPTIAGWFGAYGGVWWLYHALLAVAVVLLCRWVWGYLIERFVSQLVLVFTSMVVIIFLVICVSFTGLLMRNIQNDTVSNLETASRVLNYALEAKQNEASVLSKQLAANEAFVTAITTSDRQTLTTIALAFMADNGLTSLVITDQSGKVLVRGSDTESWGDSLSSNLLVRRALLGVDQASLVREQTPAGNELISVQSAVGVMASNKDIIGSLSVGTSLDTAFVDGLHEATDLAISLYVNERLVAASNDVRTARIPTGTFLANKTVKEGVYEKGQTVSGTFDINNQSVLAVFSPLRGVDDEVVGAVSLAVPVKDVLKTAGRSIELTFGIATLLLAGSFVPTYLVARNLKRQLQ